MHYRILAVVLLMVLLPGRPGWSRTQDMKQVCADCHTMHNSQGGAEVVPGALGKQSALLNSTCYGCHTTTSATANSSASNLAITRPYVLHTANPQYGSTGTGGAPRNTLAGGDFYWVAGGSDLKGHNVSGISTQAVRVVPGSSPPATVSILTCAGTNGCHGNPSVSQEIPSMYQSHHGDDTLSIDGSSLARSFRFLSGMVGLEDGDYELTVASGDHNQYKGVGRIGDTDADATTISHLCARCHGDFHSGAGNAGIADAAFSSPWIRHPVDYEMGGVGGEYAGYGPGGNYNVATPLGSSNVSAVLSSVNLGAAAGQAVIVCVTCHRAHGSPYDYSLRWDYQSWPDAGGYNGCGDCHTVKN